MTSFARTVGMSGRRWVAYTPSRSTRSPSTSSRATAAGAEPSKRRAPTVGHVPRADPGFQGRGPRGARTWTCPAPARDRSRCIWAGVDRQQAPGLDRARRVPRAGGCHRQLGTTSMPTSATAAGPPSATDKDTDSARSDLPAKATTPHYHRRPAPWSGPWPWFSAGADRGIPDVERSGSATRQSRSGAPIDARSTDLVRSGWTLAGVPTSEQLRPGWMVADGDGQGLAPGPVAAHPTGSSVR